MPGSRGTAASRRGAPLLAFAALATGIYAIALYMRAILPGLEGANAVAAGLTVDLAVVVPLVWYGVVVRRLGWPWVSVVPVMAASLFAASRIIPPSHHQTLAVLERMAVPLELALLGYVGWRATRAIRRVRSSGHAAADPFSAIRWAAAELVPHRRLADIVADELSVLYGGLASWWVRPRRDDPRLFTGHHSAAHASVVAGLLLAMAVELFPVHVLLSRWSPATAWIVTVLSVYGAVWFIADLQALRLRPHRLAPDGLDLRAGLRWDVSIPLENIARVERVAPGTKPAGAYELKVNLFGDPTHRVTVWDPVVARSLYGFRRQVHAVLFAVDEAERFDRQCAMLRPEAAQGPREESGRV